MRSTFQILWHTNRTGHPIDTRIVIRVGRTIGRSRIGLASANAVLGVYRSGR